MKTGFGFIIKLGIEVEFSRGGLIAESGTGFELGITVDCDFVIGTAGALGRTGGVFTEGFEDFL